jgi:hypothetical protein
LLFQYREQQQRFYGEDSLHVTPFSDGVQDTRIYVMWGEEVPTIGRGDEKFIARMKGEKAAVRWNVPKVKKSDAAFLALVASVRKKLTKPQLTKSVREKATKKQIASWTQVCWVAITRFSEVGAQ